MRARVRLVPALPSTRYYKAIYDDLAVFLSDLLFLIHDGHFDTVQGFVNALAGGGWNYTLEATKNFAPGYEPADAALLAGLRFLPGQQTAEDVPYFDYLNRLAPTVEFLKQIGVWSFPHPWIDLLVPTSQAASFIGGTLAALDPADVGQGPILVYPYLGDRFQAPKPPDAGRGDLLPLRPVAHGRPAHTGALGGAGDRQPPALRAGAGRGGLLLPGRLRTDEPRGLAPAFRPPLAAVLRRQAGLRSGRPAGAGAGGLRGPLIIHRNFLVSELPEVRAQAEAWALYRARQLQRSITGRP